MLEPQDRWEEFRETFTDLVRRFNLASDGTAKIRSDYFVIRVECSPARVAEGGNPVRARP